MKKRKIKKVIEQFIEAVLIILSFYAALDLFISLNLYFGKNRSSNIYTYTINKFIFLCVFIWITALLRKKRKLQIDLLLKLRADLLIKSEFTKAGVADKYKEGKEEDLLVYVLGLLSYEKESLDTAEDIDSLLKEFKRLRQEWIKDIKKS